MTFEEWYAEQIWGNESWEDGLRLAWQGAQANQEAIVKAALEAAATQIDFYEKYSGTGIADEIRNLDVQQILESVK